MDLSESLVFSKNTNFSAKYKLIFTGPGTVMSETKQILPRLDKNNHLSIFGILWPEQEKRRMAITLIRRPCMPKFTVGKYDEYQNYAKMGTCTQCLWHDKMFCVSKTKDSSQWTLRAAVMIQPRCRPGKQTTKHNNTTTLTMSQVNTQLTVQVPEGFSFPAWKSAKCIFWQQISWVVIVPWNESEIKLFFREY